MEKNTPNEHNVRTTWKILVIDDDEEDYIIVREMLNEAQGNAFDIHWASSYKAGCEALHSDHYNAVLVDYDLGAETGIELIREAIEKGYSVPLILFTGRGTYAVDVEAMEAGATLYLSKGEATPLLLERSIRYAIELKQREQALRASEERFEKAFNASPNAQVISHIADGRIETINGSFAKLFGYHREEVVGRTSLELNMFANPADRNEAVRQLLADQSLRDFVLEIRTKSGEARTASLSMEIITIGNQRLLLTVIEDITERKRSEANRDFLTDIAQVFSRLSSPGEIMEVVGSKLGAYLNVFYCHFMYIDEARDEGVYLDRWNADSVPRLPASVSLSAHVTEAFRKLVYAGQTVVSYNTQTDPIMKGEENIKVGAGSFITVPFHYRDEWKYVFSVHDLQPRQWRADEIELVREVALRLFPRLERARAETELRERESRLREFFESTHDAYFALDREWRFTYVNHRFGTLMGIDPREVIGKNFWEMYPQYLGTDVEQCYRKVMTERVPVHYWRQGIYTGNYYDLALYPTQEGLASFASDRTEEVRRQQQVEEERARLEAVLSGLPVGVWITDIDGRIIGKNQRSDQIWAGDAPMSEDWEKYAEYEMCDPDSGKPRLLEEYPLVRVLRTGQAVEPQENLIRRFDGSYSFAVVSASPIKDREGRLTGAVAIMLDINERKHAEMELRKSEASLRESEQSLAEAQHIAHLGSWKWNLQTGELLWSSEMYVIYGLDPNSFVPSLQSFTERIHPADREMINQQIQAILTNETTDTFQFRILRPDGTERILNATGKVTAFDDHGKPLLMVGINQDISQQVRLEAEKQQAIQERTIHQRLMEQRELERQSIARDIHDGPIQTLSSLLFNLQSLREAYADPALQLEVERVKLSIKSSVQELRQVMYELRPPSVIQFGLSKAIKSHNENLFEIYPQITWSLELDDDGQLLPQQTCLMLFRVYQEAVNNIIRHSEAPQAWVKLEVLKGQIILEIRDNGKGFVKIENLTHLTENRHFGLAGMAERVEAIHGALELQSTPGEGTAITVKIPVEDREQR